MMHWSAFLLSGGPRDHGVGATLRMPLDDFPVHDSLTAAEAWLEVISEADVASNAMPAPMKYVRLLADGDPRIDSPKRADFWIETPEPRSHRGVAGSIADAIRDIGKDDVGDWVLVLESSACPAVDIEALFRSIGDEQESSVILGISDLERISGCYMVRRDLYDLVPDTGFFDFKEQLLSRAIEANHRIGVVRVAERARRMHTREGWISCVKAWIERSGNPDHELFDSSGPWKKREGPCVIRPTATVEDSTILSSIIMDGAVVEPGAVVARSIVGPGVRVPADTVLVDAVLATGMDRAMLKGRNRRRGGSPASGGKA